MGKLARDVPAPASCIYGNKKLLGFTQYWSFVNAQDPTEPLPRQTRGRARPRPALISDFLPLPNKTCPILPFSPPTPTLHAITKPPTYSPTHLHPSPTYHSHPPPPPQTPTLPHQLRLLHHLHQMHRIMHLQPPLRPKPLPTLLTPKRSLSTCPRPPPRMRSTIMPLQPLKRAKCPTTCMVIKLP